MGESPEVAAERGGREVALPVLAATLATVIVFFPLSFFMASANFCSWRSRLAVILSLFASYLVAMTVVPLFCAKLIKGHHGHDESETAAPKGWARVSTSGSTTSSSRCLTLRKRAESGVDRPLATSAGHHGHFHFEPRALSAHRRSIFSAHRSQPVCHQTSRRPPARASNLPTSWCSRWNKLSAKTVSTNDLKIIVSNIGVTPGFSSIYTPNSGPHTAFVQVGLNAGHHLSSFEYMDLVRAKLKRICRKSPPISRPADSWTPF